MISQGLKHQVSVNGAVLEYDVAGARESIVLIHGALLAEAYAPLCAEPALTTHSRLVRCHRRGHAGSSRVPAPFSTAQQATDCRALLQGWGIERAHVVGHSSGGAIALQLVPAATEVVHSLVLLEPAAWMCPAGPSILSGLPEQEEQDLVLGLHLPQGRLQTECRYAPASALATFRARRS
jgi:pimeloyl-ACP methyl ester carboxylesterase